MLPPHDRAAILSTGDEIITGQLQDSNARHIAQRMMDEGVVPVEHAAVGDSLADVAGAIRRMARRTPLIVMTGGLGPTDGDLTREALAEVLGDTLIVDEGARADLVAMLTRRGREVSERQLRQALRPSRARCLRNALGTAPGQHAQVSTDGPHGVCDVFCLPGPPGEMRPMLEEHVLPALRREAGRAVMTRLLHVVGVAEADCVMRLGDLTRRDRAPLIGVTASSGILTIRMRFDGRGDGAGAARALDEDEARIRAALGEHVFWRGPGGGAEAMARAMVERLAARGETLAVAESCTGGMLGELLTSVAGSSAAFRGGFITYANEMKVALGVDAADLSRHGAVSAAVAGQMAERARERAGATHALAITGIAGPGGGSEDKPVGTVHVGLASAGAKNGAAGAGVQTRRFLFTGDREDIRRRSCVSALAMLYFHLCGRGLGEPRLLWER